MAVQTQFVPDKFFGLLSEVDAITRDWEPDTIRSLSLNRLLLCDRTALPYFRNLLCNVVYNSHGAARKDAQRILRAYFDEEVNP